MAELPQDLKSPPKKETENQKARRLGIPKWLKRYHARYGSGGVESISSVHAQLAGIPMINHWRDRRARIRDAQEL